MRLLLLLPVLAHACRLPAAALVAPPEPAAQAGSAAFQEAAQAEGPDPFAGFETHVLGNGLKVWYGRLRGATHVSVGVAVPFGADEDPRGKEELAHFTEHMLFSDHAGRTEQEILDDVDTRGGVRNGFTAADRTFYFVTLPAEHGLFGVEWLHGILRPKPMAPDVVDRNRQPVALEIRARPRELFEHLGALLNPQWLRAPDYWEREFGLQTRSARAYDRYASLQRITPEDLRGFYDRYYAPAAMTAIVVGDVPRDSVLHALEATFGTLEPKAVPEPAYGPAVDPGRRYRQFSWTFRPNLRYRRIFKLYGMDARDHVRLLFLDRYLDRRLSNRLRFGATKAVYGVDLEALKRGPAAQLYLEAPIDPDRWDYARDVIEEELRVLAEGSLPADEFRADRGAVVERLRTENSEAQDLVMWVYRAFYDPWLHRDFPHLTAEFAELTQAELAEFVRERLTPERQVEYVGRPQPLTQGALAAFLGVLAFLTVKGVARILIRPIEMRRIRYVARLRVSPPVMLVAGAAFLLLGAVGFRLLIAAIDRALDRYVFTVDSYLLNMGALTLVSAAGLVLVVLYLSLPPRKLLLFDDELRIKHLAFRSRALPLHGLTAARATWRTVAEQGAARRTLPLALGLLRPALWLRPVKGIGYLVRVRDPEELLDVLEGLGAQVVRSGPPGRSGSTRPADRPRPESPERPAATSG